MSTLAPRANPLDNAVAACVGFLLAHQSADGSWLDWDLPPGPSGPWTTAFVGWQLAAAARAPRDETAAARRAAAAWLLDREDAHGGWGYNAAVGCDADSTAHAIAFLHGEDIAVGERSLERLLAYQQPDGGIATYAADEGLGSWGTSHQDVSAVAARALLPWRARYGTAIDRIVGYLARGCGPEGLWSSFWWSSPLYATRACLALSAATAVAVHPAATRRALGTLAPGSAFEQALLLDCLLDLGADAAEGQAAALVERLVSGQRPDGSWDSTPILRIPDRDCTAPWERPRAGATYRDPGRLFTSSTVLRALSRSRAA